MLKIVIVVEKNYLVVVESRLASSTTQVLPTVGGKSMTFNLFGAKKDKEPSSDVDNVNINKDGIVSLNLDNKLVQEQLFAQIKKLKTYESELKVS